VDRLFLHRVARAAAMRQAVFVEIALPEFVQALIGLGFANPFLASFASGDLPAIGEQL
jgi:hypothetical protein